MSLIETAKVYVKNFMINNDPSHDWYHVDRVYKNTLFICEQEKLLDKSFNFDFEIVQLAALFHDIVDFKYDYDESKDLSQIGHERLGDFFSKFNYPKEKIENILDIVLNVSWRKELELVNNDLNKIDFDIPTELKIVRDADRLESIGAIGIARCMAYSGAKNRPLYIEDVSPKNNMTLEEYNQQTIQNQSIAINFFYEKLILIKERMQTKIGKMLAQQRHEFMLQYLEQFKLECRLGIF